MAKEKWIKHAKSALISSAKLDLSEALEAFHIENEKDDI